MRNFYTCFFAFLFFLFIGVDNVNGQAGTASASNDSICVNDMTNLLLNGYNGTIQWQSFDGSVWINETGAGFDTDMYSVMPGMTTDYRALVTDSLGGLDSSNVVTVTVLMVPSPYCC